MISAALLLLVTAQPLLAILFNLDFDLPPPIVHQLPPEPQCCSSRIGGLGGLGGGGYLPPAPSVPLSPVAQQPFIPQAQQPYIPQPQQAIVPQAPQIPQYTGKG